jgi:hydrogenase expression/formation protein HypE
VAAGDVVIVSGDVGRHGIAIMAVREGLGFETEIASDCAPLIGPVRALITAGVPLHCLRDLTRGGLATALIEIAETAGFALQLDQQAIPVSDAVRGACEILGLDPLYVANEGRFVAFVPASAGGLALGILRRFDPAAAIIGRVGAARQPGVVNLDTLGGLRPLDLLSGEQLPRIC